MGLLCAGPYRRHGAPGGLNSQSLSSRWPQSGGDTMARVRMEAKMAMTTQISAGPSGKCMKRVRCEVAGRGGDCGELGKFMPCLKRVTVPQPDLCHHERISPSVPRASDFSREAANLGLCGISCKNLLTFKFWQHIFFLNVKNILRAK